MSSIAPYAKAIVGALVAGLASLQQALDGDNTVTASEWTAVAVAFLTGLALVFAVPNKDPEAEHQDESVQPPRNEFGYGTVELVVGALLVLVLIVVLARLL